MVRTAWTGAMVVAAAALAGAQGFGDRHDDGGKGHSSALQCSAATLRGAYGIQMQGTRPSVPGNPTAPIESVVGIVKRVYDGHGQFTQVDNVKGSITGIALDREGFGTYEVNDDCTGVTRFQPGPGITLEEKIIIVKGGREVISVVTTPLPVMVTSVQKRVDLR